ncbi:undecaprenyl-phosphate glucose phosphotransferase [Alsobacter soli]|uniref:Undecaprenyl-phosphate glucose phosphotransferase n=1 Tax=Alsobacter soli TaxID=2109933 RepID=A0A2T1HUK1_9HYPH|nr:undecaprenyl-phosphate glucose phosphotransferase [Alsobacter soli]PSC05270.1 undecaprenyl-phosphate glucose phosphotransferase [Alsobacter soli]
MAKLGIDDLLRHDAGLAAAPRPGPRRPMSAVAESIASHPRRSAMSATILSGLVGLTEFILLVGGGLLLRSAYLRTGLAPDAPYAALVIGSALGLVVALQYLHAYDLASLRGAVSRVMSVLAAWSGVCLVGLALAFAFKLGDQISRFWFGAWYLYGLLALLLSRLGVRLVVKRMLRDGLLDRRTAIVGGGPAAESLLRTLDAQADSEVRVLGVFDDRDEQRSPESVAGYPKLGSTDDLVDFVRRAKLDLVIFTLPITAEDRILSMLRKLWVLPVDIRLSAHQSKLRLRPRSYSYIGSVPVLAVTDRPIADWDVVFKWLFDRIVGGLLLLALAPVMLLTALAVKLDSPGPVFFRQRRYGFNNELIEVFKFRSMYVEQSDATASRLVTKGDPRVTRVGRFIRKTSLDELPQLINVVLKGDLSLVGPRPHAVNASAENQRYDAIIDGYFARHRVKPGITGWAQIKGWRGETDTFEKIQKRVEHDLYYIENWSVFFDLYILLATPFALAKTENAY